MRNKWWVDLTTGPTLPPIYLSYFWVLGILINHWNKSRNCLLKEDKLRKELTEGGKAFYIFGPVGKVWWIVWYLIDKRKAAIVLRLWYHKYEFDYLSEINLEKWVVNDGDQKT